MNGSIVEEIGEMREYDPQGGIGYNHVSMVDRQRLNRWVTCFQDTEGTIYLHNGTVSTDGGRTVVKRDKMPFNEVLAVPEGALLCEPGLFLGLESIVTFEERGRYSVRGWRGESPANTTAEEVVFNIENGHLTDAMGMNGMASISIAASCAGPTAPPVYRGRATWPKTH